MKVNAPKKLTLLIAVLIAVVALIVWLASAFGPLSLCALVYAFWALAIAFVLLLLGCSVKGL
ncbi:MAG: hypothetical protein LBR97_08065 [Dysgonamonadaceae bacterium]|jgi:hypothetical protein|nr:hypothetical protein [Dysgonamonadaceae bacterium]